MGGGGGGGGGGFTLEKKFPYLSDEPLIGQSIQTQTINSNNNNNKRQDIGYWGKGLKKGFLEDR